MSNQLEIIKILKASKKIAIIAHISPDGDAVGSSLALYNVLVNDGKAVDVYLSDGVPSNYRFLSGADKVLSECSNAEYDVAVALDCASFERLGSCSNIFSLAKKRINIDHHFTNDNYADINYIEENASSAGEVIYRFIKMYGLDIDKSTAECLYVAIATDTGGFRYSNTTSVTMQVAADLLNCGIDVNNISRRIFDVISLSKVKVMSAAIDSLEIHSEKIAVMHIKNEQINSINASNEDLDGIVNIAKNIKGIEAAAFLAENEKNQIKVNLRSNEYIDVAAVAQVFDGGGHKRAAGCRLKNVSLEEAKKRILEELLKVL